MSVEAVVRHDTPQIWMSSEEDAKQIIDLPLIPVGAIIQARDARYRFCLICIRLDPNAAIMPHAQHVVHDLEAIVPCRVVHGCDIGDHGVFSSRMILEESENGNDAVWGDEDGELVLPYGELLNVSGEAGNEVLAIGVETAGLFLRLVCRVYDGGVQFAMRAALRGLELVSIA